VGIAVGALGAAFLLLKVYWSRNSRSKTVAVPKPAEGASVRARQAIEGMEEYLDDVWASAEAGGEGSGRIARPVLWQALEAKGALLDERVMGLARQRRPSEVYLAAKESGAPDDITARYHTVEVLKVRFKEYEMISRDEFFAAFYLETKILEIFHCADTTDSGRVGQAQLQSMLEEHPDIGQMLRSKGMEPDILFADANGPDDPSVDIYTFLTLLGANPRVIDLFRKCDKNGNGSVSKAELAAVLATDGKAIALLEEGLIDMPTGQHAEFLRPHVVFEQLDLNQSGDITIDEFMRRLRKVKPPSNPTAQPFKTLVPLENHFRTLDLSDSASEIPVRAVNYAVNGAKTPSGPAFYEFLGMDVIQSPKILSRVAEKIALPKHRGVVPEGCPLPGLIVINMHVPRDAPALMGQKLDGPTSNMVVYLGITEATCKAAAAPKEEQSNALHLHIRYWRDFKRNRKLQEQLKMIAFCRNIDALGGTLKMFASWNGKPVLLTRSTTVYTGQTSEGVTYGGVDINFRCWAYAARQALAQCIGLVPKMVVQVAFTVEGDPKKRGGEYNQELPEQVFGTFCCMNMPDVVKATLTQSADFFG